MSAILKCFLGELEYPRRDFLKFPSASIIAVFEPDESGEH